MLVFGLEASVATLFVLNALYLNRWLHYRITPDAIQVRGLRRWLVYRRAEREQVSFHKMDLQLNKAWYGLDLFSGLAHGSYSVEPLARCQLHGYGYTKEAVVLELSNKTVVLTPEEPRAFLAYLSACNYPLTENTSNAI